MYIGLIEKSSIGLKLNVYSESLAMINSDVFKDASTLNFHLQALAKKHNFKKSLLVVHNKERNTVELSLADYENLFLVS
jgi:hypothetical protein